MKNGVKKSSFLHRFFMSFRQLRRAGELSDIACDEFHAALRGEGHALGSGWDENRLALMEGKSMVFVLMVCEGTAALDAHHDKE